MGTRVRDSVRAVGFTADVASNALIESYFLPDLSYTTHSRYEFVIEVLWQTQL